MEEHISERNGVEAPAGLGEALRRVKAGETVPITEAGVVVANLVPARNASDHAEVARAAKDLKRLRVGNKLGGIRIRELIEEGRR